MDNDAKSPSEVFGMVIRGLRDEHHRNQDDIATSARVFGLSWTRSTVAAVETGRRSLDLGEYFLLPLVLNHAFGVEIDLLSLVPSASRVQLGPRAVGSGTALRAAMAGKLWDEALAELATPWTEKASKMVQGFSEATAEGRRVWPGAKPRDLVAAERDCNQLVEVRAAERLGVSSFEVAVAAHRLWGRGLTEERNRRLEGGTEDRNKARALAGHVTRTLTAELRPVLVQAGVIAEKEERGNDQAP